jgi:uncharacterized protein YndB with AHSA1/START domain
MTVTVRREVVLPVQPDELWPALTEPDRMAEWFGADVAIDLRPGGRVSFRWADASRSGVVETVEPEHRLAFRWAEADADGEVGESRVEFQLDAVAEGTRLHVTESDLDRDGAAMPELVACLRAGAGWTRLLLRLQGVSWRVPAAVA